MTGAGFIINSRGTLAMIDPVISFDPRAPHTSETGMRLLVDLPLEAAAVARLDIVLYSHADDDHFARATAETLLSTGALFVGPPPVSKELAEMGLPPERIRTAVVDETIEVEQISITATPADHPWQLRDPEKYGEPWKPGECCGYLIDTPDGRIWFPGDTRLMDEHVQMQGVDVLLLDVSHCDSHLGVDNAARLANTLKPPHIIPYHWGTYDAPDEAAHNGDPAEVEAKLDDSSRRFRVLAPGERFTLPGNA